MGASPGPRELARQALDLPHWRREAARNNLGPSYIAGSLDDMTTDVAAAIEAGRAPLAAVLRELEWAGHDEDGVASCPECNWNKGEHDPKGCRLSSLLSELPK